MLRIQMKAAIEQAGFTQIQVIKKVYEQWCQERKRIYEE